MGRRPGSQANTLGYTIIRRDRFDADLLFATFFYADPSHRRSVSTHSRFDANRLKRYFSAVIFIIFLSFDTRVCVFADKAYFDNLICVGYTFALTV